MLFTSNQVYSACHSLDELHLWFVRVHTMQNGMVLTFDMRQTKAPLESRSGLSCNPVHTLISVASDSSSGRRTLLTASQIGICEWNINSDEERYT